MRLEDLADAAQLASLADETPEGRSIVVLAKEKHGLRGRELMHPEARFVPFSAQTRMSGCDLDGRVVRKGAADPWRATWPLWAAACRPRWSRRSRRSRSPAARRSSSPTGSACSASCT